MKSMMLMLPEVSYLVDRVPIAALKIEADAVQLRFFQHAKETNMSLKDQCKALGIPWHARVVHKNLVSDRSLEIAKAIPASIFAQTYPKDAIDAKHWTMMVGAFLGAAPAKVLWMANNALEARRWWSDIKPYLTAIEEFSLSVRAKTMAQRGVAWKAERRRVNDLAERMRREQLDNWYAGHLQYLRPVAMQRAYDQNNPYWNDAARAIAGGRHVAAITDTAPINYAEDKLALYKNGKFSVQLLRTHAEFSEEGKRMHHCVEQYFSRAKAGICHIVSVKDGIKRVVTAEFTADWELVQAKGAANKRIEAKDPIVQILRDYAARQKGNVVEAEVVEEKKPARAITFDPRTWGARG